jgi:3-oxoacyl-[acyl-carrier protein] reductase
MSKKKIVIVTGARGGLGLALCRRLTADGYFVVAAARGSSPALEALAAEGNLAVEMFDAQALEQIHPFVSRVVKQYGRLYGLVNNAALGNDGLLATQHESDIAELLTVNLHAPILLSKYASRSMLIAGQGRIIHISSIIASTGFAGLSVYAASKAGLIGFAKSLSRELGKGGITVNCVAPGYMQTAMTDGLVGDKLESIKRRSPSGQLAEPEDAAAAVAYLMSEGAARVTGTTITVDAGSTA